ncbi:MAG: Bax inhibitor-1/YccA family protein [Pseudomonadota bacterium]
MQPSNRFTVQSAGSALAVNAMLKKVYALLAATLLFSGLTAAIAMNMNVPPLNPILTILIYLGLLFLTSACSNNPVRGIIAVFALTGFLGFTLGPILEMYLQLPNGSQLVGTALAGTGIIFFGLSAYALTTKKDFSYLGGFLSVIIMAAFLAGIASWVFHMPILSIVVSFVFAVASSALILFQTSRIVNGGETNYIMATVTLYIALFNLFLSLLRILSFFSNRN